MNNELPIDVLKGMLEITDADVADCPTLLSQLVVIARKLGDLQASEDVTIMAQAIIFCSISLFLHEPTTDKSLSSEDLRKIFLALSRLKGYGYVTLGCWNNELGRTCNYSDLALVLATVSLVADLEQECVEGFAEPLLQLATNHLDVKEVDEATSNQLVSLLGELRTLLVGIERYAKRSLVKSCVRLPIWVMPFRFNTTRR